MTSWTENIEMLSEIVSIDDDGYMRCLICTETQGMEGNTKLTKADRQFCDNHYQSCRRTLTVQIRFPIVSYYLEIYTAWEKNQYSGWNQHSAYDNRLACPSYTPKGLALKFAKQYMAEFKAKPFDDDSENIDAFGKRMFKNKGKLLQCGYRITKHIRIDTNTPIASKMFVL